MNTKTVGATIAFTALTVALNLVRIPVPYLIGFSYQMGDIPLVIAFLLYGPKTGITVAFLNMIISMTGFVGPGGFVGAPYYFIVMASMLLGLFVSSKLVKSRIFSSSTNQGAKAAVLFTAITILTRTLIMLPLDYYVYGSLVAFVSPLSVSEAYAIVIAAMPFIILYNINVPLYVVPTSYGVAKKLPRQFRATSSLL